MKKIFPVFLLVYLTACNENGKKTNGEVYKGPDSISYSIISTYPHDTSSFTQGLVIYKGELYEGTGEYEHSKLLKVDLKSGRIQRSVSLDKKYFGEGITILNDTVYQL